MKIHTRSKHTAILLALVTMLFYGCFARSAYAAVAVLKVETSPEVDYAQTTFNASIIAEDVTGLYGWEFVLNWTAGVINCTSQTLNLLIWGEDNYLGPWVKPFSVAANNTLGLYHQSVTGSAPGVPANGTFWLANLTFTMIKGPYNSTDLVLQKAEGYTAYCLLDYDAEEIPHTYQQANVRIVPEFQETLLPVLMVLSASSLVAAKSIRKRK